MTDWRGRTWSRRRWFVGFCLLAVLLGACGGSEIPPQVDEDDAAATAVPGELIPTSAAVLDTSTPASGRLPGEPDPALTPGAFNAQVTQATIDTTICVAGWTATIRPPSSFTTQLKVAQIAQYGYTDTSTAAYEEDHLIPLQLGGDPVDARNLWPEPYALTLTDGRPVGARVKDAFETKLKKQICAGEVSLAEARARIGIDWVHVYYGIRFPAASSTP